MPVFFFFTLRFEFLIYKHLRLRVRLRFFFLQVPLGIVEFLKIGIWLHMEHQSQLNMMILQSNLFLPATWNVRMDVLDQEQISVMSVNTSKEVPVR